MRRPCPLRMVHGMIGCDDGMKVHRSGHRGGSDSSHFASPYRVAIDATLSSPLSPP